MKIIAFVPIRGGSKSIPLKNIKPIAGKPLCWWSLKAAQDCPEISEVIVATDSSEIKSVVNQFGFSKIRIYWRDPANAQDSSSTESVMLEYLQNAGGSNAGGDSDDLFILVQATNPFIEAQHLTEALKQLKVDRADSILSATLSKRFFWDHLGNPINYDYRKRPRRQDFAGFYMENGAFYINSIGRILKDQNRLSGKVSIYEMPEYSSFEIDEPDDWIICESLLQKHYKTNLNSIPQVKVFLTDIDGTLTDAGMYYSENGDELKKFNTRDGMGLKLLQKAGIKVGFLTAEDRSLNRRRASKLKLDYDFHGVEDKLVFIKSFIAEHGLTLENLAYIGDDLNDVELLSSVGYAACPLDACKEVKSIPGIRILNTKGGDGAVREMVENILSKLTFTRADRGPF